MRSRLAMILVGLLLAVGCGRDRYGREPLSGTVTFGGEAVQEGSIQFWPTDPAIPWRSGAMIRDGKYEVPAEQGLPPGRYRVVISSPGPDMRDHRLTPEELFKFDRSRPRPLSSGLAQERIPAEYNRASNLEIEVRPGAENRFDVAIPLP